MPSPDLQQFGCDVQNRTTDNTTALTCVFNTSNWGPTGPTGPLINFGSPFPGDVLFIGNQTFWAENVSAAGKLTVDDAANLYGHSSSMSLTGAVVLLRGNAYIGAYESIFIQGQTSIQIETSILNTSTSVTGSVYLNSGGSIVVSATNITRVGGDVVISGESVSIVGTTVTALGYVTIKSNKPLAAPPDGALMELSSGTYSLNLTMSSIQASIFGISLLGASVVLLNTSLLAPMELIYGNVFVGAPSGQACSAVAIVGAFSRISCRTLALSCAGGNIVAGAEGQGFLVAANDLINVTARSVSLSVNTTLQTNVLLLDSNDTVSLNCQLRSPANPYLGITNVTIRTSGDLFLGVGQTQEWYLGQLHAFGRTITVPINLLSTNGSSCRNQEIQPTDLCQDFLASFPNNVSAIQPLTTGRNITFDLILVAQGGLLIGDGDPDLNTTIYGSSHLYCAQGPLSVVTGTSLDVTGGGCYAGHGSGHGSAPPTLPGCVCGAGGASQRQSGGNGTTTGQCNCPYSGAGETQITPSSMLPTGGAAGGGCPWSPAPHNCAQVVPASLYQDYPKSAGGGLLWISGETLSFSSEVSILSRGVGGRYVSSETNASTVYGVSGGGAGGQILLFAQSEVSVTPGAEVFLSVRGGNFNCGGSPTTVSGGGAGGIIQLNWTGSASASLAQLNTLNTSFFLEVRGGGPEDSSGRGQGCASVSDEIQDLAHGQPGNATPATQCLAGTYGPGLVCIQCPEGYTCPKGRAVPCTSRPPNSYYNQTGESTSDTGKCSYKCNSNVPSRAVNNMCLGGVEYFISLIPMEWRVVILACMALAALLLLLRRSLRFRSAQNQKQASACLLRWCWCDGICGRLSRWWDGSCLAKYLGGTSSRSSMASAFSGDLHFPRDQLPYHIGRVYFAGDNKGGSSWALPRRLPDSVGGWVQPEGWAQLATELSPALAIPRHEALLETLIWLLYPPLAPVFSRSRRWARIKKIKAKLQAHVTRREGPSFWRPRQVRSEMMVSFGCDAGATLGHLDFFDFARNELDWAPANLNEVALVVVSRGHGTFDEPLCIDVSDPILQQLTNADFGPMAAYSVIAAFNRITRLASFDELLSGPDAPMLLLLREKVEQCALQCGLSGYVQVLSLVQSKGAASGARTLSGRSALADEKEPGFMDLVAGSQKRSFAEEQRSVSSRNASSAASHTPSEAENLTRADVEVKLCLVFTNFPRVLGSSPRSTGTGSEPLALTSPLEHADLRESLSWTQQLGTDLFYGSLLSARSAATPGQEESVSDRASTRPQTMNTIQRVPLMRRRMRQQWWGDQGILRPTPVMLLCVLLLFMDGLSCALVGVVMSRYSPWAFLSWILVPPFAQPLAVVIGPIFMLTESPRLGRLYASLSLLGMFSVLFTFLVVIICFSLLSSIVFDIVLLAMILLMKAALFVAVSAHTVNLDMAADMTFMDADFLNRIFSPETPAGDSPDNTWGPASMTAESFQLSSNRPMDRNDKELLREAGRGRGSELTARVPASPF